MKTMILSTVIAFLIASPVHAIPLEWRISGTTESSSVFRGDPIENLNFALLIFLDTDFMGTRHLGPPEWEFPGGNALLVIDTRGAIAVNRVGSVTYFGDTLISSIEFVQEGVGAIQLFLFEPDILSQDFLPPDRRLGPIEPIMSPHVFGTVMFFGPDLSVVGQVTRFSAEVPEGGSTALLLTSGLVALGFLRRRYKGSAS
jgi:hypothetical protein